MRFRLLVAVALVAGATSLARAEATPDARAYLDKLYGLVQESPFRMDYSIRIDGMQGDQEINAEIAGDLLQDGPTHAVNTLKMQVGGAATGGQTMTVHSRQISDGETLWAETNLVEMGMTQVAKIDLATLAEIQGEVSGLELNQSSMYMDPISQLETMISAFDVSVDGTSDGVVRLKLVPTEQTAAQLADEYDTGGSVSGVLTLREDDGVPVSVDVDLGTGMSASLTFTNFEKLSEADLPEDAFTYTPEPGVQVMDLAPLLRSGM